MPDNNNNRRAQCTLVERDPLRFLDQLVQITEVYGPIKFEEIVIFMIKTKIVFEELRNFNFKTFLNKNKSMFITRLERARAGSHLAVLLLLHYLRRTSL